MKAEFSDSNTRSQCLIKIKKLKAELDGRNESHVNKATRKELIDRYKTLMDSFKLMKSKLVQALQINGEKLPSIKEQKDDDIEHSLSEIEDKRNEEAVLKDISSKINQEEEKRVDMSTKNVILLKEDKTQ